MSVWLLLAAFVFGVIAAPICYGIGYLLWQAYDYRRTERNKPWRDISWGRS